MSSDSLPLTHNNPDITVSQLSQMLKRSVEQNFDNIRVKGEISGFKKHSSGHLYFSLKDDESVLDSICWRGSVPKLAIFPEDGMEVIATGKLTTYPGRSKYQIIIERLELAGQGSLLKLLEDRKNKLKLEGLFEQDRKKKLPSFPRVIAVITSPTGAVIQDILHRLTDRFPCHVLLWPVAVQGEHAANQIASAIKGLNALSQENIPKPDLIIVARGGGSLEDLWAFNEEIVVRAAALSDIPLISAVGHETDTTLIDFVADLRAPTPTAAAELAVPVRRDLLVKLMEKEHRLVMAIDRIVAEKKSLLSGLIRGIPDLTRRIEELIRMLDDKSERLDNALRTTIPVRNLALNNLNTRLNAALKGRKDNTIVKIDLMIQNLKNLHERLLKSKNRIIDERTNKLNQTVALLESLSYEQVLKRGFALIRNEKNSPVQSSKDLKPGENLTITFQNNDHVAVEVKP